MKIERRTPNEIISWKLNQVIQNKKWMNCGAKNNSKKEGTATVLLYNLVIRNLSGKNFGKFWWKVTVDLEVLEVETWIRIHNAGSTGLIKGSLLQFVMISHKDFGYLGIT